MAKTAVVPTYDPNAEYEVIAGPVSLKGEKGNRIILQNGEKTKLSHLEPAQIAFLVEKKKIYKLAGGAN